MSPDLSRRIGRTLGTHTVSVQERSAVELGARGAETWQDLPASVRDLITAIEQRPKSGPPASK